MEAGEEPRQLAVLANSDEEELRMPGESGEEQARGEPLPAPRLRLLEAFAIPEPPQREVRREKIAANLEDLFRCYICLGKVMQPVLCPFCSKLSCLGCTKRWLTQQKSECAHCRQTLRVSQLVNCRFVEDVNTAVKDIQTRKPQEECGEHPGKCLDYYCKQCEIAICPDCALFTDTHKGHTFGRLQEVYDQHVEKVRGAVQTMGERQSQIQECKDLLEKLVTEMKEAKDCRVKEVNVVMENIHTRLEGALKLRKGRLDETRKILQEEQTILHQLHQEIHSKLSSLPRTLFIEQSEVCMAKIKEAHQTDLDALMHEATGHVSHEFPSELIPAYFSDEFTIHDYTRIRQNEEVVFSPPLKMYGLTWRLKVYPNGNGIAQGAYLSVFLEMTEGLLQPSKYEYRVEMVSSRGGPIVREFASDFEEGECWGYNRFFKIDNLDREGFLDSDSLKLRYFVRAPSFVQEARDQGVYIRRLEKELQQAKQKIRAIQEEGAAHRISPPLLSGESEEEGIAVREEKSSDSRGEEDQLDAPRLQIADEGEESGKEEEEEDSDIASPLLDGIASVGERDGAKESKEEEKREEISKEEEPQLQESKVEEGEESQEERKEIKKIQPQVKRVNLVVKTPRKGETDKPLNPYVLKIRKKQVINLSREASGSPKLESGHSSSQESSPNKQI